MPGYLTLHVNESEGVWINTSDGPIEIKVKNHGGAKAFALSINAPRSCPILRASILERYGHDWDRARAAKRSGT